MKHFKKFLALLLCVCLCVSLVTAPAKASGAAWITLASSGSGAIAAGSGTILGAALPILTYVLAAGVLVYSVYVLCDNIMDIYNRLSDDSKAELAEIYESGADSYTLSESLATELANAFGEVYYTDDGSFVSSGVTFDPSALLVYDYSSQYVYGNEITSSIYKYSLSGTSVSLGDTSLTARLVDSPFTDYSATKALEICNTVSGVSCVFTNGTSKLQSDHAEYFISVPYVQSFTDSTIDSDYNFNALGVWVLIHCPKLAAGETCDEHYMPYDSVAIGEQNGAYGALNLSYTGTGIDALDGNVVTGQYISGVMDWRLMLQKTMDGVSEICLTHSALQSLCSTATYTAEKDEEAVLPVAGTTLSVASAAEQADVNLLVSESTTDATDTDSAVSAGLLAQILELLKGNEKEKDTLGDTTYTLWDLLSLIWDSIKTALGNMFGTISDGIASTIGSISDFFSGISDEDGDVSFDTDEVSGFFAFLRDLWTCIPEIVRSLIMFGFALMVLFTMFKVFI